MPLGMGNRGSAMLMFPHRFHSLMAAGIVLVSIGGTGVAWSRVSPGHSPSRSILESYGALPLAFEPNTGQTDPRVRFLARGDGYTLFLAGDEAVLSMREVRAASRLGKAGRPLALHPEDGLTRAAAVVRMRLLDANPSPLMSARDPLPGKVNFFHGNDPSRWRAGIPTFATVAQRGVYPGIDLIYYGNQGRLEYDFVVAPGADPGRIRMQLDGAGEVRIDAAGDLVLATGVGPVRLERPVLYQEHAGARQRVDGDFVLDGNTVAFRVGAYDASRTLVIDPILIYSSFAGGTDGDEIGDVAVDALGQAHLVGSTLSTDFPTGGTGDPSANGLYDAFVTKLNAAGTAAVYSTYLGGANEEGGLGIAIDPAGDAYAAGYSRSPDFPITPGAADAACTGCAPFPFFNDAFVTKFDALGNIVYSTFIGGNEYESAYGLAVDAAGNAYVAGGIANGNASCTFPIVNGYDGCANSYYDAFVTKVNATGTAFLYSTTLGGANDEYCGCDIAVDGSGNAYMTGLSRSLDFPTTPSVLDGVCGTSPIQHDGIFDAIAVMINTNAAGSASLVYSTCVGGGLDDSGSGITIDGTGRIWMTGATSSTDFPTADAADATANGGGDAFVVELDPLAAGAAQVSYGTYLGGGASDNGADLALDGGHVWVVGSSASTDFPTVDPIQAHQGGSDAIVVKLDPSLAGAAQIVFSSYLGGCENDGAAGVALDLAGSVYFGGTTASTAFPTTAGVMQAMYGGGTNDAFIVKITGSGPSVEVAGCLPPTATLLSLFEATSTSQGVEVRWAFSEADDVVGVALQRSDHEAGPWLDVAAEQRVEGGVTIVVDRGAMVGRVHWYRLVARTVDGRPLTFGPFSGVARAAVSAFALRGIVPNPSAGATQIEFTVAHEAAIRLSVVDVQGREIAVLAEGVQRPGRYRAVWDGRAEGGAAPAGLYFVRYANPDRVAMERLVLTP